MAFFPHSEAPSERKESEFRFSEDTLLSSTFDIESFCGHLKFFREKIHFGELQNSFFADHFFTFSKFLALIAIFFRGDDIYSLV